MTDRHSQYLADTGEDSVPISNVESHVLAKILEYCEFVDSKPTDEAKKAWEAQYLDMPLAELTPVMAV